MSDSPLAVRRARFVYEAARLENAMAGRPINPEPWERRDAKFRRNMIAAVARQVGTKRHRGPKAAHDAWVRAYARMGWKYGPGRDVKAKTHPDMVSYRRLGRKEREKDWVYLELCKIAARVTP